MAENFTKVDDRVIGHVTSLGSNSDFDYSPNDWSVPNVEIHTYVVGDACDVKLLADAAGDFANPDTTITLDSFGSSGISEGNATPLVGDRSAGRITNTGSAADFVVVGEVVG